MKKWFLCLCAFAFMATVSAPEAYAQPKKATSAKPAAPKKSTSKQLAAKKAATKAAAKKAAAKKVAAKKLAAQKAAARQSAAVRVAAPLKLAFPNATFQEVRAAFQLYKDAGGYPNLIQAGACVREQVLVSQKTRVLTFTSGGCLERESVLIASQLKPHGMPVIDFGEAKALLDAERALLPPKPVAVAEMAGPPATDGYQNHREPDAHRDSQMPTLQTGE